MPLLMAFTEHRSDGTPSYELQRASTGNQPQPQWSDLQDPQATNIVRHDPLIPPNTHCADFARTASIDNAHAERQPTQESGLQGSMQDSTLLHSSIAHSSSSRAEPPSAMIHDNAVAAADTTKVDHGTPLGGEKAYTDGESHPNGTRETSSVDTSDEPTIPTIGALTTSLPNLYEPHEPHDLPPVYTESEWPRPCNINHGVPNTPQTPSPLRHSTMPSPALQPERTNRTVNPAFRSPHAPWALVAKKVGGKIKRRVWVDVETGEGVDTGVGSARKWMYVIAVVLGLAVLLGMVGAIVRYRSDHKS